MLPRPTTTPASRARESGTSTTTAPRSCAAFAASHSTWAAARGCLKARGRRAPKPGRSPPLRARARPSGVALMWRGRTCGS
eukprot:8540857-Pyramimonas_sp.AAC.1